MENNAHLVIEDSNITFDSVASLLQEIEGDAIVILPSDASHHAFFSGTLDLRDFFSEQAPNTPIKIAATDESYRELALHSADFWIGTFLVGTVAVPVLVNLLSSYIFDALKAKPDDRIKLDVVVERKNGKSTMVSYKGAAKDFPKVAKSIRDLADD